MYICRRKCVIWKSRVRDVRALSPRRPRFAIGDFKRTTSDRVTFIPCITTSRSPRRIYRRGIRRRRMWCYSGTYEKQIQRTLEIHPFANSGKAHPSSSPSAGSWISIDISEMPQIALSIMRRVSQNDCVFFFISVALSIGFLFSTFFRVKYHSNSSDSVKSLCFSSDISLMWSEFSTVNYQVNIFIWNWGMNFVCYHGKKNYLLQLK